MRSLRLRLLFGAAAAIAVALFVSWIALVLLFERHIQRNTEADLIRHGQQLISELTFTPDGLIVNAAASGDQRFDQPASGVYWQVTRGDVYVRSRSLWDNSLALPLEVDGTKWHRRRIDGPFDQRVLEISRKVKRNGEDAPALVQVAINEKDLLDARSEFARELGLFLVLLWGTLSAAAWLQVRIGLSPLKVIEGSIGELKNSPASRLDVGRFATEVSPLAEQINELADAREGDLRAASERAANLAHALKTPLSALRALSRRVRSDGNTDLADGLESSIQAATDTVERELSRARTAASQDRGPTLARSALEPLIGVLRRTERGGRISFNLVVPADVMLPISRDQLLELAGPVLENAVRFAAATVRVTADSRLLVIEDDGPGLGTAERDQVILRGQRADERPGGHGLGLAIANDLAQATDGLMELETSDLGGLRVRVSW
ncbi:sensor histidine kinase [Hyphomonas sp.]|uniref:sensor histidine kinase n=1 Tax=Hyphomonas sp. TaxID=87 RepID=UPI0025B91D69|nr:sensor histidine kinase [Hyphomonas sp.]